MPIISQLGHVFECFGHSLQAEVRSSCNGGRYLSQKFGMPSCPGDFQLVDF